MILKTRNLFKKKTELLLENKLDSEVASNSF